MIIHFVSGNAGKTKELNNIINNQITGIQIEQIKLNLNEYQGSPEFIVKEKLKLAADSTNNEIFPLLVEDTSLSFNAFNYLPGPYIKYFLEELKPNGLYKLLSGFNDHTAIARSIFGLQLSKNSDQILFIGETTGEIVEPRGSNNFGWDSCFQPSEYNKTYAELDENTKNKISHRSKSLTKLISYLENINY